jgi:ABC-2 type transport system ATP-binding protein
MSDAVISTRGLSKRFGRKKALRELTLEIPRGGVHALVGRNGAGKTTLFRLLLGFLAPSAGRATVLGADSADLPPEVRGRVGWVTEEHALPPWMTVGDVAALQRAHYPRWREVTFREVLEPFRLDSHQAVKALSRGERAGLSLALALAQGPEVLLLDEPTLGLDVVAKHAFLDALLFTGEGGAPTVVYASHQMEEVERLADRLLILKAGELVSSSTPDALQERIGAWLVELPERPNTAQIPGLLQARRLEEQWEVILLDPPPDVPALLTELGGTGVQPLSLGFDRAVNAFLAAEPE